MNVGSEREPPPHLVDAETGSWRVLVEEVKTFQVCSPFATHALTVKGM